MACGISNLEEIKDNSSELLDFGEYIANLGIKFDNPQIFFS